MKYFINQFRIFYAAIVLWFAAVPLHGSTTLAIAIAGEPWSDPSLGSVGTALTLAKPPAGGFLSLVWSATDKGVMGVSWKVQTGNPAVVLLWGKALLAKAAVPGASYWTYISATFLASAPPAIPVNYQLVVTPFDGQGNPIGVASPPVTVTQEVDNTPPTQFGRAMVFPSLKLLRYEENVGQVNLTQLQYATGALKVLVQNDGQTPTDSIWLSARDNHGLMRQITSISVPSLTPSASTTVQIPVNAVLPPPTSQLPEDRQYTAWRNKYTALNGVDLVGVMDWGGPKASSPMNDHREVALYKGSGDSCRNGKLDGDESVPDCNGSCGCCFGSDVPASSWRDVYGFNFPNTRAVQDLAGAYDLGDLQSVYGDCSIYLWPCIPIPTPHALAFLISVKIEAGIAPGLCFGFGLSALRFINGAETVGAYPSNGPACDIWHLRSPLAPGGNADLARLLKRQHLYQFSSEALHAFLEARVKNSSDYWISRMKGNLPALVSLGNSCSHAVVAHHVTDRPDGGLTIETYDPNLPFTPGEGTGPAINSRINVSPDGQYTFDENPNDSNPKNKVDCRGAANVDLTVFPYDTFPTHVTMPTAFDSLISFGGVVGGATITQVMDGAGHNLFLTDGSINTDPKTQIRAFPFHPSGAPAGEPMRMVVMDGRDAFTHTIAGTAPYQAVFLGPGYSVQADAAAGAPGDIEQVTIDPARAGFAITTSAARKVVHSKLSTSGADHSTRSATIEVTLSRGGNARMEFDAGKNMFTYRHQGPASDLALELWSSDNPDATVHSQPLFIDEGDILTVDPDWHHLDRRSAPLRITKKDGRMRYAAWR